MSNIRLMVEPDQPPMKWREFYMGVNSNSVALDGYVAGATNLNHKRKVANFNHHEDCNRYATRATCDQVRLAIHSGLFDFFRDESGDVTMDIYVNDCDEDVCLSVFLLMNGHISDNVMNPALNQLIHIENELDTTAGAYPYPKDYPLLKKMAWIFAPYRLARKNGVLQTKDPMAFRDVITNVCSRINEFISGQGQEMSLDTQYEVLHEGTGWSMVNEIGFDSRTGMFADGLKVFASQIGQRENGNYDYVIGKMSPFIPFNLDKCLKALNEAEGNEEDVWGGSDTIGGSPRTEGSKLSPGEVIEIIETQAKG